MKRFFYYAVALLSMATVSFTSCDDEDDNEKKETSTPANPQTLGQESQTVINKLGDGSEADLMQSVSKLSDADALQAAKVLVEYNKNKADSSWVKTFTEAAATTVITADRVKEMLDQAVAKLATMGAISNDITAEELAAVLSLLKDNNTGGDSSESGAAAAQKYETFFDENHDLIMEMSGMSQTAAAAAYMNLTKDQQATIMGAVSEYSSHKGDATWVSEFIGTVANKYSATEAAKLKELFDTYSALLG